VRSSKFSTVAPHPFRRAGLGGAKSFASEHALAEPLERPRALFGERIDLLATVEREGHLSGKATTRQCGTADNSLRRIQYNQIAAQCALAALGMPSSQCFGRH
jgi:hypothetical protein